ncbi:MAG: hypothetical protein AcusKO_34440 [Acuticoccus sp.]
MTLIVLVAITEWLDPPGMELLKAAVTLILLALLAITVRGARLAFLAVAAGLSVATVLTSDDWADTLIHSLALAAFIGSFFSALCTLRLAADSSPGIRRCGRFLAQQPPGRRYAALTVGGQLFALLLNYGSLALLGSLATQSAREEPDPEIRAIRTKRMLLAVHRGFLSTLPWSPLSFAMAVSTTLLPGTSWGLALLPCLVSGFLLAGIGYGLDTLFKPRLSGPRPRRGPPQDSWRSLTPLLLLLVLMFSLAGLLHLFTAIRIVGLIIVIVPVVAVGWVALQARDTDPVAAVKRRSISFVDVDLPAYRGELTLLMMASYIGTVGAHLLQPMFAAAGFDLSSIATPIILVAIVWLIPVAGHFAMNPILSVSLFGPLLPAAAAMGVAPNAVLVAITAGWAISGATSPFTATTLLIGSLSGKSTLEVGLGWNGVYALLCAIALSGWVLVYAYLL